MITAFAILAYTGILLCVLICLLIADILFVVAPHAAMLPFLAILFATFALPMIASRGGK